MQTLKSIVCLRRSSIFRGTQGELHMPSNRRQPGRATKRVLLDHTERKYRHLQRMNWMAPQDTVTSIS